MELEGFELDPSRARELKRARAIRFHVWQLPRLRALGFVFLGALAAGHDAALDAAGDLTGVLYVFVAAETYTLTSHLILRRFFRGPEDHWLVLVFMATDLAFINGFVYVTGGPTSLLFFLVTVRAADLVYFDRSTIARMALLGIVGYALMLSWVWFVDGQPFELEREAVKVGFMVVASVYMASASSVAHKIRQNTSRAIRVGRRLIGQLDEARQQAEASNRAKSAFLANMSHEMRTPLNGILGMNALMMQSHLPREQAEMGEVIRSSGQSLLELINEVLDFSKIEAGRLELYPVEFAPRELADELATLLGPTAYEKGIALNALVDPSVPTRLVADAGRIRQVLTNLAMNAVKFTEAGEVRIEMTVRESTGLFLDLAVADTGAGIAKSTQASLFQPFMQGDASSTRENGGTGLGLAICKRLCALMGGELRVDSVLGRGSRFHTSIEVERASTEAEPRRPLSQLRVAVLIEHPTTRRAAAEKLIFLGADVTFEIDAGVDGLLSDAPIPDLGVEESPRVVLTRNAPNPGEPDEDTLLLPATHDRLRRAFRRRQPPASRRTSLRAPTVRTSARVTRDSRPILLVEDNLVNQRVAQGMLQRLGFEVEVVENGFEAVKANREGSFSLILMDCQMPVMDGFEATQTIREQERPTGRRTPIIALTAHALQGDRDECIAAGMDDYLTKPIQITVLQATLERWHPGDQSSTLELDLGPKTSTAAG